MFLKTPRLSKCHITVVRNVDLVPQEYELDFSSTPMIQRNIKTDFEREISRKLKSDYIWKYYDNGWHAYEQQMQRVMEDNYLRFIENRSLSEFQFKISSRPNHDYKMNLTNMYQKNIRFKTMRAVKRD